MRAQHLIPIFPRSRRSQVVFTVFAMLLPTVSLAQSKAGSANADEVALRQTTLSMDAVKRMYQTDEDFAVLEKAHPDWKDTGTQDDSEKTTSNESIDDSVRKLSVHPEVVAAITKNGLTPRAYVLTEMALTTAAFAEATAKQNNIDLAKMADQANLNPANITFVTQHKAELEALQEKVAKASAGKNE